MKDERSVPNLKQLVRFQGQWEDEETGLYYNRYRYYDPKQGRYITQDPIGLAGGLNSYAYVANPTGWVDPLGLDPELGNYSSVQKRDTGWWAQTKAFVKGAISYPKDVVRTAVTGGSVVCEGFSTACAQNVENSRRIGRALHDCNNDPEVAKQVDMANKLATQVVMNDPVIQSQIAGRATVATIVGTGGAIGMGLNVMAITGGALRASEAGGDFLDTSELVQGALGVDLE